MATQKEKGIVLYQDKTTKEVYYIAKKPNTDVMIVNAVKKPVFALNNSEMKNHILKYGKRYTQNYAMNTLAKKLDKYADRICWYNEKTFLNNPYSSLDFEWID